MEQWGSGGGGRRCISFKTVGFAISFYLKSNILLTLSLTLEKLLLCTSVSQSVKLVFLSYSEDAYGVPALL